MSDENSSGAGLLSRDQILGKKKLKTDRVDIPDWGGAVNVRELSSFERDEVESWMVHPPETPSEERREALANLRGRLAAKAIVDEQGLRMFTDDDAVALGNLSAAALDAVFDTVLRLSAMTKEQREKLRKNLKPQAVAGGSITA